MFLGFITVSMNMAISLSPYQFFSLYFFMHKQSIEIGKTLHFESVRFNEQLVEILDAFREIMVGNRKDFFIENLKKVSYIL